LTKNTYASATCAAIWRTAAATATGTSRSIAETYNGIVACSTIARIASRSASRPTISSPNAT
jgi:hypothetical protein